MLKTILLGIATLAAASAQSAINGQLTVDGAKVTLSNVYAYSTEGFFDKKKDDIVVLLTDRTVSPAQARDTRVLRQLAESGKLCFVQETINASGQIVNYTIGHRAFKALPSGGSTEHVFDGKLTPQSAAGKAYMKGPGKFFGTVYEYSATFNTPVQARK